jgi:hypothetical protein
MSDELPGKAAQRPVWLRAWTVAVARMPDTGWPTGRWRRIGLSCLGIVVLVVAAGVVAGGVIGAGALELLRMVAAPDPLVAREAP